MFSQSLKSYCYTQDSFLYKSVQTGLNFPQESVTATIIQQLVRCATLLHQPSQQRALQSPKHEWCLWDFQMIWLLQVLRVPDVGYFGVKR